MTPDSLDIASWPLVLAGLVVTGLSALAVSRGAVDRAPARRVWLARMVAALGAAPLIAMLAWYSRPAEGSDGIGLVIPALMVLGLATAAVFTVRAGLVLRNRSPESKKSVVTVLTVLAATPLVLCVPCYLNAPDAADPVWAALRYPGLVGAAAAAAAVLAVRRPAIGAPACFVAMTAYPSVLQPLFLLGPVLVAGAPMLLLATMLHLERSTDHHSPGTPADSIQ